jgi:hypothetical protein
VDVQIRIPSGDALAVAEHAARRASDGSNDVGATFDGHLDIGTEADDINSPTSSKAREGLSSLPRVKQTTEVFTARVTRSALEQAVQPLIARLWLPLRDLATVTRTQLRGQPPDVASTMGYTELISAIARQEEAAPGYGNVGPLSSELAINPGGPATNFKIFFSEEPGE